MNEVSLSSDRADTALGAAKTSPLRRASLVVAIFTGNGACALIYDALPPILPALSRHFGGGEHGDFIAQLASTCPCSA